MPKKPAFTDDDLEWALESAATFLDAEEWPGERREEQQAAYREAAKRIRAMVKRSVMRRRAAPASNDRRILGQ